MSYLPTSGFFGPEERKALSVSKEKLAQLDPETRLDYLMRYHEVKATQSEAFWNAISSFAAVAVPLLAFLGIERATRK